MDRETEKLLGALRGLCPAGGYVVLTGEELAEASGTNALSIARALAKLGADGMINVRFSEGGEYCLAVTNKGRECGENHKNPINRRFSGTLGYVIAAAAAFVGALLGAVVGAVFIGAF